jgi:hypothetical protein
MNRSILRCFWGILALPFAGGACATGAIGVRECREVETLRCQAAAECEIVPDVPACERYVRDHCLHGIEGPTVPTRTEHDACLALISDAQKCAVDDPELAAQDCDQFDKDALTRVSSSVPPARSVCDVISRPWDFEPCGFLNASSGGAGGSDSK